MKIKATYATEEEIPSEYRELFEERAGIYQLTQIEGIKTEADVLRVSTALDKERKEKSTIKTQLQSLLGSETFEEVQSKLDRIPELEASAAGKMDDEKIQALLEAKVKVKMTPLERELSALKLKKDEYENKIVAYEAKENQRKIHDAVRTVAARSKVLETAQEDVLLWAERVFELSETGTVQTKDGLTPELWLGELQDKKPHWWGETVGGGSKGSGNSSGMAKNPWSKDHYNMTEQGRIIKTLGIEKARQLAALHNHTI